MLRDRWKEIRKRIKTAMFILASRARKKSHQSRKEWEVLLWSRNQQVDGKHGLLNTIAPDGRRQLSQPWSALLIYNTNALHCYSLTCVCAPEREGWCTGPPEPVATSPLALWSWTPGRGTRAWRWSRRSSGPTRGRCYPGSDGGVASLRRKVRERARF